MAPLRKCTGEQYEFLESHLRRYLACSTPAEYQAFRTRVIAEFFDKFPERASLIAAGSLPPEDAIIQPPTEEVNTLLRRAVTSRKKYITSWFRHEAARIQGRSNQ